MCFHRTDLPHQHARCYLFLSCRLRDRCLCGYFFSQINRTAFCFICLFIWSVRILTMYRLCFRTAYSDIRIHIISVLCKVIHDFYIRHGMVACRCRQRISKIVIACFFTVNRFRLCQFYRAKPCRTVRFKIQCNTCLANGQILLWILRCLITIRVGIESKTSADFLVFFFICFQESFPKSQIDLFCFLIYGNITNFIIFRILDGIDHHRNLRKKLRYPISQCPVMFHQICCIHIFITDQDFQMRIHRNIFRILIDSNPVFPFLIGDLCMNNVIINQKRICHRLSLLFFACCDCTLCLCFFLCFCFALFLCLFLYFCFFLRLFLRFFLRLFLRFFLCLFLCLFLCFFLCFFLRFLLCFFLRFFLCLFLCLFLCFFLCFFLRFFLCFFLRFLFSLFLCFFPGFDFFLRLCKFLFSRF